MMNRLSLATLLLGVFSSPATAEHYGPMLFHASQTGYAYLEPRLPGVLVAANDDYYRRQDEQNRQNQEYYRRQDEQRRGTDEYYREQDRQKKRDEDSMNEQRRLSDQRYKSLQGKPQTESEDMSPGAGGVTQSNRRMEATYWKYDNKLSPDGRVFNEYDHWLEFHQDGSFKETVWVKQAPTGNMFGGSRGPTVARIATGKYTILEDPSGFLGELVYDDDPALPVRLFMPRRFGRFWPPEGFNLSQDPRLEDSNEMNWKRTRRVGERPPQYKNF
jgi:hypothetical protein